MIFGSYPCCDGDLCIGMPERSPAYLHEQCPHCGASVWHRLSRVDSRSWIEADFLTEHEVDADARTIKAKPGTEAERFETMQRDLGEALASGKMDIVEAMAIGSLFGSST